MSVCMGGVTIEHLLSHTSGVPDLFNELPAAPVDSTRAVIDAAIVAHLADPLRSPPGERYAYNNFGYFLVAYAIEVVTGELWESVLPRRSAAKATGCDVAAIALGLQPSPREDGFAPCRERP